MEFLKKNKKKILVLSLMVVLLVATGVLNWALNKETLTDGTDYSGTATEETFFNSYRTDRTALREEELLELDAIINSTETSAEAKKAAENMRLEIVSRMDKELYIEGLIKGQGFEDVIVTLGDSKANVVVMSGNLEANQAAQIIDIVVGETEYTAKKVNIIPYS